MAQMPIEPMLCMTTPAQSLAHYDDAWIVEPKLDGERLIAERKSGVITLWTRRAKIVSSQFPEVVNALKLAMPAQDWIIDGELTVDGGFESLLKRNTSDRLKISILSKQMPATLHVFDLMAIGGLRTVNYPLSERREMLTRLLKPSDRIHWVEAESGIRAAILFSTWTESGGEGVVLKKRSSTYQSCRSADWVKCKKVDTVDVQVIGATRSDAGLPFGALILAKDGQYFGKVGSGFTDRERTELLATLLIREPLRAEVMPLPQEVEAEVLVRCIPIQAEVRIQERLRSGQPRHPVWVRLRE